MQFPIETTDQRKAYVDYMKNNATFACHKLPDTNYTVGIATFPDGWSTLGYSVCVSDADFNQVTDESIAKDNALEMADQHFWRTIGHLAKMGYKEVSFDG